MFRFCDSFDHYDRLHLIAKWTALINLGHDILPGRNGNGLSFARSGIGIMPGITKTLDYHNKWTVGFAYLSNNGVGSPGGTIYQLLNNGQILVQLVQEHDSTITVYGGTSPIANFGFVMNSGVWYYIEIQSIVSAGVDVILKVNGNKLGEVSGAAVGFNATTAFQVGANRHFFGGSGNLSSIIDDLYICDDVTPGIVDFMGDVKIGCIYPRADTIAQFTPSSAGSHYPLVNEHSPDDDTTYVMDNNLGDSDTYLFDNVASFAGTIPAIHLNILARKDDEGYRALASVGLVANALNGTKYINDSYVYYTFPDDSVSWTPAAVNATSFGVITKNVT